MKNIITALILLLFTTSLTAQSTKNTTKKVPKLTFLWETDTLLTTVESVLYDKKRNVIYASNINGNWLKKNGKGFISKIDLKGNIISEKWVTGLEGTTGTAMYNDKLYVADFETLVEINPDNGKITNKTVIDGAQRINDITVTEDGTFYASDTPKKQLFKVKNGVAELVLDSVGYPNGLLAKKDYLLVGLATNKSLEKMDYKTKKFTKITDGIKYPDGIVTVDKNNLLVSSWDGVIYFIDKNGTKTELLNTTEQKINAADIDYVPEQKLLLVPAMSQNKIMAYKLTY